MAYYPSTKKMLRAQMRPISKKRSRKMMMVPYKGKKYSGRNQQLFMGQKKAARYGFFMDMLKKYAAVKAIGSNTNAAQRMVTRVTRRKIARKSATTMRIKGYRVSKFVILSIRAPYTADAFLRAGYLPSLQVKMKPFLNDSQIYQAATSFYSTVLDPGVITDHDVWSFHPTWPGSKMSTFDNYPVGNPGKQGEWGLLTGNSFLKNDNVQYNSRAVENVKAFGTGDQLGVDRLDLLFRKINVYKTFVKFEFWNNDRGVEIDVHIVHFKFTDVQYSQGSDNTCQTATNLDSLINEIGDGGSGAPVYKKNNWSANWQACIDSKKLPPQNFITKSWKTFTLGRAFDGVGKSDDTIYTVGQNPRGPSPYKKFTFKYGPKIWYREGCIEEGTLFQDDTMTERQRTDTQVMFFCTVNKKYWTVNSRDRITTSPIPTTEVGETTFTCNYKISKTHLWREDN